MSKYLTVLQITLQNIFEYRWNFFLGRLRNIILLLTLYYLWITVFAGQKNLFGFTLAAILTYVYIVQILRSMVLDTRSDNMDSEIAGEGKFFSYLLRPVGYFKYWLTIDLAYKIVNVLFTALELFIIAKLLNISLLIQTNFFYIMLFIISMVVAAFMYFLIHTWISSLAFWLTQVWGARFALTLLLEFSSGAFFPLDVLPANFQQILNLTPFPYLVYFPAKLYLGQLSTVAVASGLFIQFVWLMVIFLLVRVTWQNGLKVYTAFGG